VAIFEGLPERFVRGLVFEHVTVTEATAGVCCTQVGNVRIDNVDIGQLQSPAVDARDVEHLDVHRLTASRPSDGAPVVFLDNVSGAFVHGCGVRNGDPGYQWLRQQQSQRVTLLGNDVPEPPAPAGRTARR
jgi:hypothetical protein